MQCLQEPGYMLVSLFPLEVAQFDRGRESGNNLPEICALCDLQATTRPNNGLRFLFYVFLCFSLYLYFFLFSFHVFFSTARLSIFLLCVPFGVWSYYAGRGAEERGKLELVPSSVQRHPSSVFTVSSMEQRHTNSVLALSRPFLMVSCYR